jgi:hypothetical protein
MALGQQERDVLVQAMLPATNRVAHFVVRLDAYLPRLKDDAARRTFLDRQLEGWERRYARFVLTEGESEPFADSANRPQAFDFLLTIAVVAARRDALNERRSAYA